MPDRWNSIAILSIIWVLGEPKHLVQPQYHLYRACRQLSKSMKSGVFFWNSKGPRRSRFHTVDTKFVPNRGLHTIEHSKNATR